MISESLSAGARTGKPAFYKRRCMQTLRASSE